MNYHYIYKTTNLVNDKYYIGKHSTNSLNVKDYCERYSINIGQIRSTNRAKGHKIIKRICLEVR
ncbi:MAG: hypothetical protein R3230_00795 [Nitrosopumilaceae archaeon]|nr:hypothetical protein [Nitrosopumilaceae archaeon]